MTVPYDPVLAVAPALAGLYDATLFCTCGTCAEWRSYEPDPGQQAARAWRQDLAYVRLARLLGSPEMIGAVNDATELFNEICEEVRQQNKADRERREAAYAEVLRRHELAIRAECPWCGATPGSRCRTVPGRHLRGSGDHADRYRAAVHLFGPPEDRDQPGRSR
jgi:hypothetical protein